MDSIILDHILSHKSIEVYSFDLFDTVLTRSVCAPRVVFALAAREAHAFLPGACSPAHFAHLRERADACAHRWHGNNTTLDDIYRELQNSLNLSASAAERLKAAELAVEQRVLYPIPRIQATLQSLRARGVDIVFTSDMYLPAAFLKEQLVEHGIWQAGDRLFVSCEYGLRKTGGRLFTPMLQETQCDPHETIHIGNCEYADVKGARQAGLQSVHFDTGNLNRYEEILANHASKTAEFTGCMAGASRYARLHTAATSRHEQALRDVTAGVVAPILTGFVLWILERIRNQRLERLYFTSRDGHALVPIARRLADALGVDGTFKYLYLSRAALTAANPDPDMLYHMLEFEEASGEAVLSRYGLDVEDVLPHLPAENVSQQIWSHPLTEDGKQLITTALSRLRDRSHAIPKIDQRRDLLRRYLIQEGLHEAGRCGLVDIGWKGSVHSLLSDFLVEESIRTRPLPAFLFGLSTPQQPHAAHRTAYFFDAHRKMGHRGILQPGSAIFTIMEVFCTADHGTVTGYRNADGRVIPTLAPAWAEQVTAWGLPIVRRTLDTFVNGLTQHAATLSHRMDARNAFTELLQAFWHDPSPTEANAWGTFPREIGQGRETATESLAPPHRWTVLTQFMRHGPHTPHHLRHQFSWPQGSRARSSSSLQSSIDYLLRARRFAKGTVRRMLNRIPDGLFSRS